MNTSNLTFTANDQELVKNSGLEEYASNSVSYIKATFTLGENWSGFDSVRAVWSSYYNIISTVLDTNNSCLVPAEMLLHKSEVKVNLVGSIVENNVLTDRLTTFPIKALKVSADAKVNGTETAPVSPSQFEQFVNSVEEAAQSVTDYSYDSEAWAKGTRGGVAVPSTDETYHNNSKYYADQGAELSQEVTNLKSEINDNTSNISALQASVTNLGTHKVAQPLDGNNQPTNGTSGQSLRTKGDGTTEWADVGLPTDEQTAEAVSDWLDDHPEATTTVQDGSLTEAKFADALKLKAIKDYVTPEMFGAKGDGITDDTQSLVAMLNSGAKNICLKNKYLIDTNEFIITTDGTHIFGGGTLLAKDVGAIGNYYLLTIDASDVFIENITCDYQIEGQSVTTGQEWGHCFALGNLENLTKENVLVKNCKAIGANGDGFSVRLKNCTLINCSADRCRRNGFTVVSEQSRIIDCKAINTAGTLPEAGLDIEPDTDKDVTCDIQNFYSQNNNMAALTISGHNLHEKKWNINIDNLISINDGVSATSTENYTSILNIEGGQLTSGEFNVKADAFIVNPSRNPIRFVLSNSDKYNAYLHATLIGDVRSKPILMTRCRREYISKITIELDQPSAQSVYPYYDTYLIGEPNVGTDETNVELQYINMSYNGESPYIEKGRKSVTIASGATEDVSIVFSRFYWDVPILLFALQNTQNGVASKMEHVSAIIRIINTSTATIRLFNYSDASLTFDVHYAVLK